MFYLYLLQSEKDKKFYIGSTSNLQLRFKQHSEGKVKSTSYRRPFKLIYYESYSNKGLAEDRERKLKKFGSAYVGLLKRLSLRD